jgi:hypothetical protein
MNYYLIASSSKSKVLSPVKPSDEKESKFLLLWQQKNFTEALNNFPDKWLWASDSPEDKITDMPPIFFTGLAFSEHLFNLAYKKFPRELETNHSIIVDGLTYYWVSPPVINEDDLSESDIHLATVKPSYAKYVSEEFVDFFKSNGFTGTNFKKIGK